MKIIKKNIKELIPASYNPRMISGRALSGLRSSIKRYGLIEPIIWNEKTGNIVGGHQRLKILLEDNIKETDVVVVSLEETEEKSLNITLNNPAITGEYTENINEILVEIKQNADINFDDLRLNELEKELNNFIEPHQTEDLLTKEDVPTRVKYGDVWRLGKQLLICDDSKKYQQDYKHEALIYDPPWDNEAIKLIEWGGEGKLCFTDSMNFKDIINKYGAPTWVFVWDCQACWYTPNRPLKRVKYCLWYGNINEYDFEGSHYGEPNKAKTVTNTRGTYEYKPDNRGKHLADLYAQQLAVLHKEIKHSQTKPLDWVRCLIGNCTCGLIFDPYAGAGTTLLAAEQLKRESVSIEIDPKNCDTIIERWENLTKLKAKKI